MHRVSDRAVRAPAPRRGGWHDVNAQHHADGAAHRPRPRRTTSAKTPASAPRAAAPPGAAARADGVGIRIGSHRVSVSTLLLVDVVLLCVIGLVMVGSASSVVSIATYGTPYAILIPGGHVDGDRCDRAVVGPVRRLSQAAAVVSPLILLVTFGLLLVVLVPGLGVAVMGSSRWVGFGQFRLQPSELMKLALTLSPPTSSPAASMRTPPTGASSARC